MSHTTTQPSPMKLLATLVAGVALFGARPLQAQQPVDERDEQIKEDLKTLKEEVHDLKDGLRAIYRELRELKGLLQGRDPKQASETGTAIDVVVSVDDDPIKGDRAAKVTLIEFSDYQCPFCARFARDTMPQIEAEYVKTGKVRYVFRDFPIASIHPGAAKAAEAAHCASDQGKYWEMRERLFAEQGALEAEDLARHASALGLNADAFAACLSGGKYGPEVEKDLQDGVKAGVQGTPTIFLGLTDPNDANVKATRVIAGAHPYDAFKKAIDSLLGAAQP